MATTIIRGTLLRDGPAHTLDRRDVNISDFRGRRNVVLIFDGEESAKVIDDLRGVSDDLDFEEAVVLLAPDSARPMYEAPSSAVFLTDRYGEIFFCARDPEPLHDGAEVLKWLEFINAQCPE